MRFKLWKYVDSMGHVSHAVQDTTMMSYQSSSWLLRDQSNYEPSKMEWKNAAYPGSVERVALTGKVIAEAESLIYLDANLGR